MIEKSTVIQVQNAANILEVVGEHVSLKRTGQNYVGLCPFHEEKTPSFTVSPSKGIYKCFGCGAGGSVFQFLMRKDRVSFPEAVEILAQRVGIAIRRSGGGGGGDRRKIDLAQINQWAAEIFRKNLLDEEAGRSAREYLSQRGLSPQTQEKFGLGLALSGWDRLVQAASAASRSVESLSAAGLVSARSEGQGYYDRFRGRLIFPIIDASDRVIGFAGRSLEQSAEAGAKYLNSPETALFNKRFSVYGLDQARQSIVQKNQVIVVEGYTDCLMAHQNGISNVVATMGTALTEDQASLLRRFCENVVVVFDSDEAGRQAADRSLGVFLRQRMQLRVAGVPEGKDPCDYISSHGAEAFQALIDSAPDALQYKWELTRQAQQGADSPRARHQAIEEFLASIAQSAYFGSSDPVWRGLLINQIAKLVSLEARDVLSVVNRLKAGTARRQSDAAGVAEVTSSSALAKAYRQVLEVLLNRPECIEKITETLSPEEFPEPQLKLIAQRIFAWARSSEDPELADLLSVESDLERADLIVSLAEQGSEKGNFQSNLSGALECISAWGRRLEAEQFAEPLRQGESELSEKQVNELLEKVQARLRIRDSRNPGVRV